ncbi:unnamed protein product [Camellia sinensis]
MDSELDIIDGVGAEAGHVIRTTIGGRNGQSKQAKCRETGRLLPSRRFSKTSATRAGSSSDEFSSVAAHSIATTPVKLKMEQRLANTLRMTVNEKKFIETALLSDLRVDGRRPFDYRRLTIKFGRRRFCAIQQQRFAAASQFMSGGSFPYDKCMNIMNNSPRSAAVTLMIGDEYLKFGCCRTERNDFSATGFGGNANSCSRQIYLTFPADSTFREEDVANYFSKFGPAQGVRIPYQQKQMFGFVTFLYLETVKIILAKGNPHFVCDSCVLVKPYKEKVRKQQHHQLERGEFSSCLSPSGIDSGGPYDLPIGPSMFYNTPEIMLRRKLEEQAELQQAIELHERRLMNLQLMDLKNHHHSHQFQTNMVPNIPIASPAQPHLHINQSLAFRSDGVNQEASEENYSSPAASNSLTVATERQQQHQQQDAKEACNNSNARDSGDSKEQCSNLEDADLHESLEHILPDNLFASPIKSAGEHYIFSTASPEADDSTLVTTTSSNNIPMLPTTSTLNMASLLSCSFQMPRVMGVTMISMLGVDFSLEKLSRAYRRKKKSSSCIAKPYHQQKRKRSVRKISSRLLSSSIPCSSYKASVIPWIITQKKEWRSSLKRNKKVASERQREGKKWGREKKDVLLSD